MVLEVEVGMEDQKFLSVVHDNSERPAIVVQHIVVYAQIQPS